jgi:hypothetical protein
MPTPTGARSERDAATGVFNSACVSVTEEVDRHAIQLVVSVVGLAAWLIATSLSNRWTTRKERRLLERGLGRAVKPGEEDSLSAWLNVPTEQLERVAQELEENPFNPVVETLDRGRLLRGLAAGESGENRTTD